MFVNGSRVSLIVLLLLGSLAPFGFAQTKPKGMKPRLALVSTERSSEISNLLALTEVRLSANEDIDLVDRRTVNRALAEQKLSLSGFVKEEDVLKVGRLLGVDLFAVLETDRLQKKVLGLVVFDAVTGVRVWDAPLTESSLEKAVDNVSRAIASTIEKHRRFDKDIKTVCVSAIRNIDMPQDQDSICDTVGFLLERRLIKSPSLVLLERKRLAQVLEERELPTDSPLRRLLASVVRVELQFRRGTGTTGIQAMALLYDGAGKKLSEQQVIGSSENPAKLADSLMVELAKMLKASPAKKVYAPELEATRFAHEAQYLYFQRQWLKELKARDAAIALNPVDFEQRRLRIRCLTMIGSSNYSPFVPIGKPPSAEQLRTALEWFVKAVEETEKLEAAWQKNPFVLESPPDFALVSFANNRAKLARVRTPRTVELLEKLDTVSARVYKARLDHALASVVDRASFEKFLLSFRLYKGFMVGESYSRQSPRFQKIWKDHARTLFELGEKHGTRLSRDALSALFKVFLLVEQTRIPLPEMEHYRKTLQESGDPLVGVTERFLKAVRDIETKSTTEKQKVERLRAFRLFLQETIETQAQDAPELRTVCYDTFADLLGKQPNFHQIRLMDPMGNEVSELVTFMVAQKDYHPRIAQLLYVSLVRSRTRDLAEKAVEHIDSLTELLDSPQCQFLIVNRAIGPEFHQKRYQRMKLATAKQQFLNRYPLLSAALVNPWKTVREFVDVLGARQGAMRFCRPLVHDDAVYVVVLGQEDAKVSSRYVQLVRFSLPDGQQTRLGKMSLDTGYVPPTDAQRTALTGYPRFGQTSSTPFVTDTCIVDGKYILGTRDKGVVLFSLGEAKVERLHTKNHLPSNSVQCLAGAKGWLLLALGSIAEGSFLVKYDLRSGKASLISSNRRADVQSPFDDCPPWMVDQMVEDTERNQVLFLMNITSRPKLRGLWALDGTADKLTQVCAVPTTNKGWMSPVWEDRILCAVYRKTVLLDLKTGQSRVRPFTTRRSSFLRDPRLVDVLALTQPGKPPQELFLGHFFLDGWLWSSDTFTRTSHDGKTKQRFPSPRKDSKFPFHPHECFRLLGNNQVLLGDAHGLWLATLE